MEQRTNVLEKYDVIVGWDWADEKHDLYFLIRESNKEEYEIILSTPTAINEWVSKFPGKKIAVVIEQKRGSTIFMLSKYKNIEIFPINTTALANYRKAFSPSNSKNDKGDAWLLLDILLKHSEEFTPIRSENEDIRKLNFLNELRRKSVDQKSTLINELKANLKMYYPQAIALVDRVDSDVSLALLMKWSTFDKIKAADENVVRKFFYKHNLRSEKNLQAKLELVKSSISLTNDLAIIEPFKLRVNTIVSQIRILKRSIAMFDNQIEKTFQAIKNSKIFNSLPGAGAALAPRILCIFGQDQERYESALEVSTMTGIAPVTEKSGKKEWVHWRWNASTFMRQTLVEFAGKSTIYSKWAGIYYKELKAKGKGHNAALRALAFKWVRIIFRCWKDNEIYNEDVYIESLIKSGSWIGMKLKNTC